MTYPLGYPVSIPFSLPPDKGDVWEDSFSNYKNGAVPANYSVVSGTWVISNGLLTKTIVNSGYNQIISSVSLKKDIKLAVEASSSLEVDLIVRYQDENNFYLVLFRSGNIGVWRRVSSTYTQLALNVTVTYNISGYNIYEIHSQANTISAFFNNRLVASVVDNTFLNSGRFGVGAHASTGRFKWIRAEGV